MHNAGNTGVPGLTQSIPWLCGPHTLALHREAMLIVSLPALEPPEVTWVVGSLRLRREKAH